VWPRAIAVPIALLSLWVGCALFWRARRLDRAAAQTAIEKDAPLESRQT